MENEKRLNIEKDIALDNEKKKTRHLQLILARMLRESGFSNEVILRETGLPIDEINKLD